jgi:hypothetical protein
VRLARFAGLLYLIQMATGVFGFYAHGQLVERGDAAQTAKNIIASERFFRLGTVSDLLTTLFVIVLTWALYVILKPADQNVALLAVLLRLAENAIAAAAIFTDFLALRLLTGAADWQAFSAAQQQTLARLLIASQGLGLQVAFIFTGFGTAVFSYLWWKSRFIPRPLAALGIIGALLLALGTLAIMLFPSLAGVLRMAYMAPLGIFEITLGLWLLIKGVPEPWPTRSS